MIVLVLFAFIAGVVTILSPCILPILPIVLSGAVGGDKRKPWGIVTGFVASFTLFTLFLSSIVQALNISADSLRLVSIVIVLGFGISLLIPKIQTWIEIIFAKVSSKVPNFSGHQGYWGGFVIGISLGLIWTPCVGPILASVISLAITGTVGLSTLVITLAYSLGTAIPMFIIMYTGRKLLVGINPVAIQKLFGVLMIGVAVALIFGWDRQFQVFILDKFPAYGQGLTKFEDNSAVQTELDKLREAPVQSYGSAPEIIAGGEWFNSEPLQLASLRGKVVLIDFWTYTCINCIRTLPYLRAWHDKYSAEGLVIIGVHAPEFEFEKSAANVKKAITDFGLTYPIVQDNNFATWRAYSNQYWPAKYLVDKLGNIVYYHFGEGDYDEVEAEIQKALDLKKDIANPTYTIKAKTPELYLGAKRSQPGFYTTTGTWNIQGEYAQPSTGSSLKLNFEAQNVFLVMKSADAKPGTLEVYLDGTRQGSLEVQEDKLYEVLKLNQSGKHLLELRFDDSNLQLFAFTFG